MQLIENLKLVLEDHLYKSFYNIERGIPIEGPIINTDNKSIIYYKQFGYMPIGIYNKLNVFKDEVERIYNQYLKNIVYISRDMYDNNIDLKLESPKVNINDSNNRLIITYKYHELSGPIIYNDYIPHDLNIIILSKFKNKEYFMYYAYICKNININTIKMEVVSNIYYNQYKELVNMYDKMGIISDDDDIRLEFILFNTINDKKIQYTNDGIHKEIISLYIYSKYYPYIYEYMIKYDNKLKVQNYDILNNSILDIIYNNTNIIHKVFNEKDSFEYKYNFVNQYGIMPNIILIIMSYFVYYNAANIDPMHVYKLLVFTFNYKKTNDTYYLNKLRGPIIQYFRKLKYSDINAYNIVLDFLNGFKIYKNIDVSDIIAMI